MIRCIAAVDDKLGLATDRGIPWNLPADRQYFRAQTAGGWLLMGWRTYVSLPAPLSGRRNFVINGRSQPLRAGFEPVVSATEFLEKNGAQNIWIIGGAALFAQTIESAQQLCFTHISGDFHCTKFFPSFEQDFHLIQAEPWQEQNNLRFRFCRYAKN